MNRCFLTVCSIALVGSALADSNSDFKKFMNGMCVKVGKAFENHDMKFFDQISTSDFTEKSEGKTYTKQQSMAEMKQGFGMSKSMKCHFKLLSSQVKGDTGTAMTSGHMVMIMKPMKKGDHDHRMVMDMWEKETWVRDGKGWKIKAIEEAKPSKSTMDGKPFDPSKMGG